MRIDTKGTLQQVFPLLLHFFIALLFSRLRIWDLDSFVVIVLERLILRDSTVLHGNHMQCRHKKKIFSDICPLIHLSTECIAAHTHIALIYSAYRLFPSHDGWLKLSHN